VGLMKRILEDTAQREFGEVTDETLEKAIPLAQDIINGIYSLSIFGVGVNSPCVSCSETTCWLCEFNLRKKHAKAIGRDGEQNNSVLPPPMSEL